MGVLGIPVHHFNSFGEIGLVILGTSELVEVVSQAFLLVLRACFQLVLRTGLKFGLVRSEIELRRSEIILSGAFSLDLEAVSFLGAGNVFLGFNGTND